MKKGVNIAIRIVATILWPPFVALIGGILRVAAIEAAVPIVPPIWLLNVLWLAGWACIWAIWPKTKQS